jgi:hypothetical protein
MKFKFETVEELQKTLSLQKSSVERAIDDLDKIRRAHPPLLGLDGNPMPESIKVIEDHIRVLIDKYLQAPTVIEAQQPQLKGLVENSIQGASFSVMLLMNLTILQPLAHTFPILGKVTVLALADTLSQLSEEGKSVAILYDNLRPKLNIEAKDEKSGVKILNVEEKFDVTGYVKNFLATMLMMSASAGYLDLPEEENGLITLTPNGQRLLAHFTSVQHWMNSVQEASVALKPAASQLLS